MSVAIAIFKSITHGYEKVAKEGVNVVHEAATAIDRDKKLVHLAGGVRIPYDRLVVAPGIDIKFDSVPGYSEQAAEIMPHAWKPGVQTELLVKKLNALNDGATDRDDRAAQSVSLPARAL